MDVWSQRRPIADFPEKGENGVLSPKEYLRLKGRPIPGEMPEQQRYSGQAETQTQLSQS
jgi:hypothetical protein